RDRPQTRRRQSRARRRARRARSRADGRRHGVVVAQEVFAGARRPRPVAQRQRKTGMKTSLRWLPVLLWAAVIFVLSSMPVPPSPVPEFPFKDKVGHLILYAVLGTLIARTLRRAHKLALPATLTLAILMASAYGVTDE